MKLLSKKTNQVQSEKALRAAVTAAQQELLEQTTALSRLRSQAGEEVRTRLVRELRTAEAAANNEQMTAVMDEREPDMQFETRAASLRRRIQTCDELLSSSRYQDALQAQSDKVTKAKGVLDLARFELYQELAREDCSEISGLLQELGERADRVQRLSRECQCHKWGTAVAKLLAQPGDWAGDKAIREQIFQKSVEAHRFRESHSGRKVVA